MTNEKLTDRIKKAKYLWGLVKQGKKDEARRYFSKHSEIGYAELAKGYVDSGMELSVEALDELFPNFQDELMKGSRRK